jgi:hypothetical protein
VLAIALVDLEQLEQALRQRHAMGTAPRAELLHVLMLPDFGRRRDRLVLGEPQDPDLRGAVDRLRGEPIAPGGAGGNAA